jgi:chromosome segregation ATPase
MTSDLIFQDENTKNEQGGSKPVAGKRGLRKRSDSQTNSTSEPVAKKRRSGIPKLGSKTSSSTSSSSTSSSSSSSSSSSTTSSSSSPTTGSEMAELLTQQTALLTTLVESVRSSKPELKKVSKTNYRERANKTQESYKALRTTAGDYQKDAFKIVQKLTTLEQNISSEYRSSVAEVESLRSSCESFESEMSESHKQLIVLRTEQTSLKQKSAELNATVQTLTSRINGLEKESVVNASHTASLEQQVLNYETKTKEQAITLKEQIEQHRQDLLKNTNDMTEKHELKMTSVQEKLTHMTSTLETVRQELTTSTTKASILDNQVNAMKEKVLELKEEIMANQKILQEKALVEVKQTSEIQHLTSALDSKNKEMERALDGLKHTQSMSERRVDELSIEKNEMKTKVDSMETERRELEQTSAGLKSELETTARHLSNEQATTTELKADNQVLRNDLIEIKTKKDLSDELNAQITTELTTTKAKLDKETTEHTELKHAHEQHMTKSNNEISLLNNNLTVQTTKANKYEQECVTNQKENADLTTQLKVVQHSAGASAQDQLNDMMRLTVENENLKKRLGVDQGIDLLSQAQERCRLLEQKYYQADNLRKKLHNKVQELRGNVRVAVRVRPLLGNEADSETNSNSSSSSSSSSSNSNSSSVTTGGAIVTDDITGETDSMELSIISGVGSGKKMSFDKVFGQKCNQEHIFTEVSELVQSALDGYNVCIFAYGQTGSGKTFTMQGGNTEDTQGIIPRSIAQILETSNTMQSDGWVFNIKASFVEIYNEEIVDLLGNGGKKNKKKEEFGSMSRGDTSKKSGHNAKKIIVRQLNTGMSIEGLEEIELTGFSQLETIMNKAEKNRR